uniref:Uncharacterized protein n=1 Tax=Acrobeloides nanus TaxID=290746 RepID=A0A914D113_9BILA
MNLSVFESRAFSVKNVPEIDRNSKDQNVPIKLNSKVKNVSEKQNSEDQSVSQKVNSKEQTSNRRKFLFTSIIQREIVFGDDHFYVSLNRFKDSGRGLFVSLEKSSKERKFDQWMSILSVKQLLECFVEITWLAKNQKSTKSNLSYSKDFTDNERQVEINVSLDRDVTGLSFVRISTKYKMKNKSNKSHHFAIPLDVIPYCKKYLSEILQAYDLFKAGKLEIIKEERTVNEEKEELPEKNISNGEKEPRSSSERTLSQNQVFGDLGDPNKETDTKNANNIQQLLVKNHIIADRNYFFTINHYTKNSKILVAILETVPLRRDQRVIYLTVPDASKMCSELKAVKKVYEDLKTMPKETSEIPENRVVWKKSVQLDTKLVTFKIELIEATMRKGTLLKGFDDAKVFEPCLYIIVDNPEHKEETFLLIPCFGLHRFTYIFEEMLNEFIEYRKNPQKEIDIKPMISFNKTIFSLGIISFISYIGYIVYINQ